MIFAAVLALATPAMAQTPQQKAETQAVDILRQSVAFDTVEGRGRVPAYAKYLKETMVAGGFAAQDIEIVPYNDTAAFIARLRGRDPNLAPIIVTAHMDVVEADPKDWVRAPFTLSEDDTFFFGRGVYDNKFDLSVLVATFLRLKAEGYRPRRDLILALSGDEETSGETARILAARFKGALLMLNSDAGGGALTSQGEPIGYSLQAAEKTYADFRLTVTDPGGHSSRPGARNAINVLSRALLAIEANPFPPEASPIVQAYFRTIAPKVGGEVGAAMAVIAADPSNGPALARVSRDPEYVGQIRTTCVATQLQAGHAPNALPQSAVANVNCRILPGVSIASVREALAAKVNNPEVSIAVTMDFLSSPASPLRDDVMVAVRKAVNTRAPGASVTPQMSAGATDSVFYRAEGVASFGVSGLWMDPADDFAHGLNERVPKAAVAPALTHWHVLLKEISKR
jgi:acetylornithine deacetylase/succinyl-diaminopimelate desuccinylase-like protein